MTIFLKIVNFSGPLTGSTFNDKRQLYILYNIQKKFSQFKYCSQIAAPVQYVHGVPAQERLFERAGTYLHEWYTDQM